MSLAKLLAANIRNRRGELTQQAFARKIGVSHATISRIEGASQNTTVKTLEKLSRALRVDVGDLFRS